MSIIPRDPRPVKPATPNPRDAWPDWVDSDRWVPTVADEPRPTAGPDFIPTPDDDAEAAKLLNTDIDAEWDHFQADRLDEAFSDPFDLMSDGELMECLGYHPSNAYVL